jgi:hypothetical protein
MLRYQRSRRRSFQGRPPAADADAEKFQTCSIQGEIRQLLKTLMYLKTLQNRLRTSSSSVSLLELSKLPNSSFQPHHEKGRTTFADIKALMVDAGFSCKPLPDVARLFRRREMEGYGLIHRRKSITIHEPHKAKYVPSQLECLKRQTRKRPNWSMASFEKEE